MDDKRLENRCGWGWRLRVWRMGLEIDSERGEGAVDDDGAPCPRLTLLTTRVRLENGLQVWKGLEIESAEKAL